MATTHAITARTYARSGLFGNPSDQFEGFTITLLLRNFYAEVTLTPTPGTRAVHVLPHPVCDSTCYASLEDLHVHSATCGLYGGVRLLQATCKRFVEYCKEHGIALPERPGFTLAYDTNVPRQAGLAGSSAIVASTLTCLLAHYALDGSALPPSERPGLILSVESGELGIAAGLQDRVIQVYGGVVAMDFQSHAFHRLPSSVLPLDRMFLIYSENPSESGKVHSAVRSKWLAGDPAVRATMAEVAECGRSGLDILLAPPSAERDARMTELLDKNFELRRSMYGDALLGPRNLRMIEVARSVGAGVNFCGSGGAAIVFCAAGEAQAQRLRAAADAEGFTLVPVLLGPAAEHPLPLHPAAT